MLALWVIEHLDVIEHVLTGFIAWPIVLATYPLTLQKIEEAFGNFIVMVVAASVLFEERGQSLLVNGEP